MVVTPKIRGFICTTAHPAGCREHVRRQVEYARFRPLSNGPKRVLVLGSSTGYGLASRIAAAFCCGASTLGVFLEKPGSATKTATAGWYNNIAFEALAEESGLPFHSINGDAFSPEVKAEAVQAIREQMENGQVDLVVYSLASPRRCDPETGYVYKSVIKPIGKPFQSKTLDAHSGEVSEVCVPPATQQEIAETVAVMGGADWLLWMRALQEAGVLAENAVTLAYSYLGPELTHAVYKNGTIGMAKEDLEQTATQITALLAPQNGRAFVCMNKALVTQASSAIPVVPLYIALLYKVMKNRGSHEGCIEQMVRLFAERLYTPGGANTVPVDEKGRIRLDDWEMERGVQEEVAKLWEQLDTRTVPQLADLAGYRADFYELFGFGLAGVDYEADVQTD